MNFHGSGLPTCACFSHVNIWLLEVDSEDRRLGLLNHKVDLVGVKTVT